MTIRSLLRPDVIERPDIEERVRDAEDALNLVGKVKPKRLDLGGGIEGTIERIEGAGNKVLWDSRTGELCEVLPNTIRQILRMTRPDGSYIYQTTRPAGVKMIGGTLPCLLHKDSPERAFFDKRTNTVCGKLLKAEDDVDTHMKSKHKREWNALEAARKKEREDEERVLRRLNIERLGPAPEPRVTHHPQVAETVSSVIDVTTSVPPPAFTGNCLTCPKEFSAKTKAGLKLALKSHERWHKK